MMRRFFRACLLLTVPAALACNPPEAAPTTPPADGNAAATETPADGAESSESAEVDLPAAEEVLAKSLEAVGGKEAILAIESSYLEGKMTISAQNLGGTLKVWSKGDDSYIESNIDGVGKSQMWKKGDEMWTKDPIQGLRKLEGKEADQAKWSSDPILAANWNKYFDKAETARVSDGEGGKKVIEVELTSSTGDVVTLLFDADSYMPVGQQFTQETQMGNMPIRTTLSDFREINGVQIPFKSVSDMGVVESEQVTEKYEVNVKIDDKKFEPPKK